MCVLFEIKDSLIFRKFKQSDWLLQVTRLLLTNQSALFQRGIATDSTPKFVYDIDS